MTLAASTIAILGVLLLGAHELGFDFMFRDKAGLPRAWYLGAVVILTIIAAVIATRGSLW